jgi:hypothetical protein
MAYLRQYGSQAKLLRAALFNGQTNRLVLTPHVTNPVGSLSKTRQLINRIFQRLRRFMSAYYVNMVPDHTEPKLLHVILYIGQTNS